MENFDGIGFVVHDSNVNSNPPEVEYMRNVNHESTDFNGFTLTHISDNATIKRTPEDETHGSSMM